MATIFVDGNPYEADEKQNLLHACLSLGFNLEYFCWHPALGSVGACRQCAVKQFKNEQDQEGKIVMACMTPASDGTRISLLDAEAVQFRRMIIEGLMMNHPHDCPVCDEGGECHLQDMTVMSGHVYRDYRHDKRTFRNQYLGPFVAHEMNRCIQCYRCVRYYREYAGGRDLNAFLLHDQVFFGRQESGVLESEFSGNLVEICPTGVFTDATLKRHYTRKWDLQFAPSVCVHCGLGCNISPGERYGTLRRVVNRYNSEVNGYFLCDLGRYGYEFVNSERRIREPLLRENGKTARLTNEEAAEHFRGLLARDRNVIGVGSPRASLEANFALRALVGPERFYAGMSEDHFRLVSLILDILRDNPACPASLRDVESSDAVLILGEDVANVAPRMALSLRQSVRRQPMRLAEKLKIPLWLDHSVREVLQDEKGPLFIASTGSTRLDDIATETYRSAPDDLARLGFAVAHAVDGAAPEVPGLPDELRSMAARIAGALKTAERPLVITGPSLNSDAVIQAAANVARSLCLQGCNAGLSFTMPECNSLGLSLLGGRPLSDAMHAAESGAADTVVILENDLYRRSRPASVDSFLQAARHVVAIDHLDNTTTKKAELVLPAGTFAESDGTLVNNEGRAQRFFRVFPSVGVQESWRWLCDGMAALGFRGVGAWKGPDDIRTALAGEMPVLASVPQAAPSAKFRLSGEKIAREPHRYSGRTSMLAHIDVNEPKQPADADSPLAFSMEGSPVQPPPALTSFFWSPGWNSIQSVNKFQSEVGGPLRGGDPGVRVIERGEPGNGSYFQEIPAAFTPHPNELLFVPIYHIFGSEELSSSAPAVAELAQKPYVLLSPADADRLQVKVGTEIGFTICGLLRRLPVRVDPQLRAGIAGLPAGMAPLEGVTLPAWSGILR